MKWPVRDRIQLERSKGSVHGPIFLWDPSRVLRKGVKFSALQVLENQGKPGETRLV